MFASNEIFPIVTPQYTDAKRSNEISENVVSALRINNQLTVNAINAPAVALGISNPIVISSKTGYGIHKLKTMIGDHLIDIPKS